MQRRIEKNAKTKKENSIGEILYKAERNITHDIEYFFTDQSYQINNCKFLKEKLIKRKISLFYNQQIFL